MAYSEEVRKALSDEVTGIKTAGLFKEERAICAPQDSEI